MLIGLEPCSASYRSLLGTAESIIKMDSQIGTVETLLGELGTKCNSKLLDKKTINLQAWDSNVNTRGSFPFPTLYLEEMCF